MFMDKKARKKFNAIRLESLCTKDSIQSKEKLYQISSSKLGSAGNERKILIEQAMALRNAKSHIFNQLDQKKRTKLRILASKALGEYAEEQGN